MKSFSMQIEGQKILGMNDYFGLTQDCLGAIKQNFPTLTVGVFVSAPNAVCPVFFLRFDSVGTFGVDFFNQYLFPSEFYYLCPPILKAVSVVSICFTTGPRVS